MIIRIYREEPILREPHSLPASTYNLARLLLAKSPQGVAFVPIRSMQVLAILDAEEFVFIDGQYKSLAMLSWQKFRPQARQRLSEPVPYELVCYSPDALQAMQRLPQEFPLAMQALLAKGRSEGPAQVLKFDARRRSEN